MLPPGPATRVYERYDMDVTTTPGRRLLGSLQRLLLPASCLCCDRPLGAGRQPLGLCLPCRGRLRPPAAGCAVCGEPLDAAALRDLADGFACSRCRSLPPAFDRLWAAWSYEGPAAAVIGGLKYRRLDYLGGHLAEAMIDRMAARPLARPRDGIDWIDWLGEAGPQSVGEAQEWDLVVPVPLHWRRRLARGFNQAERIARPLAARLGLPYRSLLRRRRATRSQARLGRSARLANPAGAFGVRRGLRWRRGGRRPGAPGGTLGGAHVLLVDDVATTGATLDAAARALRVAGAERVTAVVAARTPDRTP